MKKIEVIELFSLVQAHWPGFQITELKIAEYFEQFKKYDLQIMQGIVRTLAKNPNNTFPPCTPEFWRELEKHDPELRFSRSSSLRQYEPEIAPPPHDATAVIESQRVKLKALRG